jgi:uncharacterized protein
MIQSRRAFMASATAAALSAYAARAQAVAQGQVPAARGFVDGPSRNEVYGYGPMRPDPEGLLDLPEGFSYRVISRVGQRMDDGLVTPDKFDGMGCIPVDQDRVALIRNHELDENEAEKGAFGPDGGLVSLIDPGKVYGRLGDGRIMPGGNTTLIYNLRTEQVERSHLSLAGTNDNCAGGVTPWGSWLSCEETTDGVRHGLSHDHGWVFEIPASEHGLIDPLPIRDMGRFRHEAVCIDPRTGVAYLTEDVADSLFYRYLPNDRRNLHAGGRLQALVLVDTERGDTRNWDGHYWAQGERKAVRWIDMDGVESPDADLNLRGHAAGAAIFARGEGVHWAEDHLYFTCTSGGPARCGQIMRYDPSRFEGQPGEANEPGHLTLFVESGDRAVLDYVDNITVAPNGHVIGCEDKQRGVQHVKGVTPDGRVYAIARNALDIEEPGGSNTEFAGACWSPDGRVMFVNLYSPGATLAITGPWDAFRL